MKTASLRFFGVVLVIGIFSFFSFAGILEGTENVNIQEDDHAPNFTLEDLNGNIFNLSDYKGKPVLLLFMTSWIRGTWKMIPHMKEYYSLYNQKGLILFNIDVMESKRKADIFAREQIVPYPTLLDEDGEISRKFGIVGVPMMILINKEGKIICRDCPSPEKFIEKQLK